MRITTPRGALTALALGAGIAVLAAGAALAAGRAGPLEEGMIHACRHMKAGFLRAVADPALCRRSEEPLSWNQEGPAGPPGEPGRDGPAGPPGPQGPAGPGLTALDELNGLACTTAGSGGGTVELDPAADGTVRIRCVGDGGPPPPPGAGRLVINEVDYDQVGVDHDGFVEILNVGEGEADLSTVALVLVDGGTSREYRRHSLSGTLAPGEYLVVDTDPQNGSPDGIALVDTAARALLDALSYEGEIRAAEIGPDVFDLVEGTPLPASVADSNTIEGSLVRFPDGTDTDDAASDWAFTTTITRGAANVLTP